MIISTVECNSTDGEVTVEMFESVTTSVIFDTISDQDLHVDNPHKLDISQLVIFIFIGASCLAAIIARRFSTKIKQLCGFRLSRSESAKQSKRYCDNDEDDF